MLDSDKDVEMSERSDTGQSVSGDGDQQDLPHPWPYLKEFLKIVEKLIFQFIKWHLAVLFKGYFIFLYY